MKRLIPVLILLSLLLGACAAVDLNTPVPVYDTGVDPEAWTQIPAGAFHFGQFNELTTTGAYEIMVTDVTTAQYARFLNEALSSGEIKIVGGEVVGYYPGDTFREYKHEEEIAAGDW